jgi:uncharacterized membrane protein YtjA (UPF0391 family)
MFPPGVRWPVYTGSPPASGISYGQTVVAADGGSSADPAKLHTSAQAPNRRCHMLHYAVAFFIIALIAALFGFSGIAASATGIAKILFAVFLVVALVTFILGQKRRV